MGREGDEKTVVDTSFKVKGVKGLRVADLSVAPLMINNHTQSTAYLIVSLIQFVSLALLEVMLMLANRGRQRQRRLLPSIDCKVVAFLIMLCTVDLLSI